VEPVVRTSLPLVPAASRTLGTFIYLFCRRTMLDGYLIHTALVSYLALRREMRLYDGLLIRSSAGLLYHLKTTSTMPGATGPTTGEFTGSRHHTNVSRP